jgi:hypothetical protein
MTWAIINASVAGKRIISVMHSRTNMPRVNFTADIIARAFSAAVFQMCVGWKMLQKFSVPLSTLITSRKQSIYSMVNNLKTTGSLPTKKPNRKLNVLTEGKLDAIRAGLKLYPQNLFLNN